MNIRTQVRRSDIQFDHIAGRRVLAPVATTAIPGEVIEIEWYPQEWCAATRINVWRRVPSTEPITPITPLVSIGALFTLDHVEIGPQRTDVGLVVPEWVGEACVIGPGRRFALAIRAHAEVPAEQPILVTVAIELPPPCFAPRAAA